MNRVLEFARREPVRAALFPLITALVAYLVARGAITESLAPAILAVVALALGLPVTEVLRSKVTPAGKVQDAVTDVVGQVQQTLNENASQPTEVIVNQVRQAVEAYAGRHRSS